MYNGQLRGSRKTEATNLQCRRLQRISFGILIWNESSLEDRFWEQDETMFLRNYMENIAENIAAIFEECIWNMNISF